MSPYAQWNKEKKPWFENFENMAIIIARANEEVRWKVKECQIPDKEAGWGGGWVKQIQDFHSGGFVSRVKQKSTVIFKLT